MIDFSIIFNIIFSSKVAFGRWSQIKKLCFLLQIEELKHVTLKKFPFYKYPHHVRDHLKAFAWKSLVVMVSLFVLYISVLYFKHVKFKK